MNVNNTLDLLEDHAPLTDDPDKCLLLRDDIIQAIKFDLGDEFSNMPEFELQDEKIAVPKLPYDKVYFEAISFDGKRYGALFESHEEYGVCGQMLAEAIAENNTSKRGLFPSGLMFTQDGDKLRIHVDHDGFEDINIGAIMALDLMVKAISVLNCSNIKVIESPEKKLINNKRKQKGKLPIFTFKTLHIEAGDRAEIKLWKLGTHASPRVHLRRGHIRKLPSGKEVWVQHCTVGDKSKGIVHKDYSLSAH
jgi:hypothetical protein